MIPKRIVAIGASICHGSVDPKGGGFVGRLRSWREGQDQHNLVYNLGISGDTSAGVLKRLTTEVTPRRPDLIIIQLGINDTWREGSPTTPPLTPLSKFTENMKKIITQAKSLAGVLVISIFPINERKTTPLSWVNRYYFLDDAKNYAQATKDICAEIGVPYLDIFNQWLKEDYIKKYVAEDGLHANARGHHYVFEVVRDHLLEHYK